MFDPLEFAVAETLSDKLKALVQVWDKIDFTVHIRNPFSSRRGRPEHDRRAIARAFIAKAFYNLPTTEALVELLKSHQALRRLCGFETIRQIPSVSTFSRAFSEFAKHNLGDLVHEQLVRKHVGQSYVMHVSRDSTEVIAREKAAKSTKSNEPQKPKHKRGRPKKGEVRPAPEPTVIEKQLEEEDPEVSISQLSKQCNFGCKKDSGGHIHTWKGYKAHIDWADGEIPLTVVTTSASVHDSQVAIPLSQITAKRCKFFYELMDSAYDADAIRKHIDDNGRFALIDPNKRNGEVPEDKLFDPAMRDRYKTRTTAERGNSLLKDCFGLRNLRVRGHAKAHMHIMLGVLTVFATQILRLARA